MKVTGISWVGFATDHYEATLSLFTDVLGLEIDEAAGRAALLKVPGGGHVELFGEPGPGKTRHASPTVGFEVDDVRAAREELIAAGIEIVGEIGAWNGHEWLCFRSPDGHLFEVKTTPR